MRGVSLAALGRSSKRLLLSLLCVYVLYVAALYVLQDSFIYPGRHRTPPLSPPTVTGLQQVVLEQEGARSVSWYLPALPGRGDHGQIGPAPVLIVAHGNGEIADDWIPLFSSWRELGLAIFLVEYPGYGRSGGDVSEVGIRQVMMASFDWLAKRPEIDAKRITALGVSLGGGAVGHLLRDRPLAAAILVSTFTSMTDMAHRRFAPGFLLRSKFDTVGAVRLRRQPLLVIHGLADPLIPAQHGAELAAAGGMTDFQSWPDCGHDCIWLRGEDTYASVQHFLRANGIIR